jgi:branched-subunit amino acid aminotransferase/4-amino-4-deoxychorismate lyase
MVTDSRVLTPPLASGCLPGVTRDVLVNELQIPGIDIAEHILLPADLEQANEIFITSTTRELLTVTEIEGLKIRSTRRVADRLQEAFSAYVEAYVAQRRKVLQ